MSASASELDAVLREHWWGAVGAIARRAGDLEIAEDAVQEACAAAVAQWPSDGIPPSPRGWLITTAWHKAVDAMRRDSVRAEREAAAARELGGLAGLAGLAGRPWVGGPADEEEGGWVADGALADGGLAAGGGLGADDGLGAGGGMGGGRGLAVEGGLAGDSDLAGDYGQAGDDELALIFACCHPALDPAARVALTLKSICGLPAADIAAAFVVAEPTMAQRLVRAKRKIRQAGIPLTIPGPDAMAERLNAVLRVVYLVYTQGHRAASGTALVRADLCDQAIRLARQLAAILPREPEVAGLLGLLLLTDARSPARIGADGSLVLLADQDRTLWKREQIVEGEALIEAALRSGRPGAYQLHAAIAACHSTARSAEATDWPQIAALYRELVRYEPTPVVLANQAVAIAMAEGAESGLAILDGIAREGQLVRWPQLHIARAELLRQLGRAGEAAAAYELALAAGLPRAEEDYIATRLAELSC